VNEREVALAVEEWVNDVIPELVKSYPYVTAGKADLPDAMIDVQEKSIQRGKGDERFPWAELQQRSLKVFDIQISLMVDRGDVATPEEREKADEAGTVQLQEFGAALEEALLSQPTLGDRVQMASPYHSANYALPFVKYADGTRGRQMTMSMSVGELVDQED